VLASSLSDLQQVGANRQEQYNMGFDNKLPWFKFYANDFLARTIGLTNEQVGIYSKLQAYTWAYGPLPNDLKVINSIVQGGEATELVLARFFRTNQNGDLYEPSLEVLRDESLELAEMNRKRTAGATAKRRESSRERYVAVTSTEVEVEVETDREKDSNSDSEAKLDVQASSPPRAAVSLVEDKIPIVLSGHTNPNKITDPEKLARLQEARRKYPSEAA
jgi:uncharacterized protein YdaU (DUF1376 family)